MVQTIGSEINNLSRLTRSRATARDNQLRRRSISNPPVPPLSCEYCERVFTTKTGMGVHKTRAHPDELDRHRENEHTIVKMRWSQEEISLLALQEVKLIREGKRHINQILATLCAHRSVEAIKKVRQKADYKASVSELLNARGGNGESSNTIARAPTATPSAFLDHIINAVIPAADLHSKDSWPSLTKPARPAKN